jgi:hypothetical protein
VHQIDVAALQVRIRDNLERKVHGHEIARNIRPSGT